MAIRYRILFGSFLAVIAFLGGCAGLAPQRAEPAVAPPAEEQSVESEPELVPPVEEEPQVALSQPAAEEPSEEAAPAGMPAPAVPGAGERAEVYSASSPRSGAPAAADGSLPDPRPPAVSASAPPAPAQQPAPTPSAAPAKAKAGAAAPASASPPPKTPAPASGGKLEAKERRREVLARKGDSVVIELEGKGWLFLGLPQDGGSRGLSFVSSESSERRSAFTFKALELGEYDLVFQLQDNSRGVFQSEAVRLRVLPEQQFRELVARQASPAGLPAAASEPVDPIRLEKAERLFAAAAYELALPEYLKLYREGDPLLNDRLATIYAETNEPQAAVKYFEKNRSASAPYAEKAAIGLIRAGMSLGSSEIVSEYLDEFLALRSQPIERELVALARFFKERARYSLAYELLQECLSRYPRGSRVDSVLFQLAQLYELDSPLRDLRKARAYYEKVYKEFPESASAEQARSRILYLDRYFFNVQ